MKKLILLGFLSAFPIITQAIDKTALHEGIKLLFKDAPCEEQAYCLNDSNEDLLVDEAIKFKNKFDLIVKDAKAPTVTWVQVAPNVKEFTFDSLVNRGVGHPSNQVKGLIYFPKIQSKCDVKMPATLLIHKLASDIDGEKQIAQLAASLNRGIVMIMYLPEYGPRASNENFLNSDFNKFEFNIMQSLSDIHQANLLLKSLPQVNQKDVGLMGLSLGAFVSLISAGIDPVFDHYGTNVGGGDLANILNYKKSGDTESLTGQALATVTWSVDQARYYFSRFDAITWSHQVKNKSVLMVNANSDELIARQYSIDKLVDSYSKANTKVKLVMHKGTHVFNFKEVGYLDSITKVIAPMMSFISSKGNESNKCFVSTSEQ